MSKTATHIQQIGRVMVPVTDQDKAVEFYVEKLGFEKRTDIPFGEGYRWIEVAPSGSQAAIALVTPQGGAQPGGMTNIALTTDDVDVSHAALKELGVDVDKEIMRGDETVPQMFWFRDQDGNTLMLVETE